MKSIFLKSVIVGVLFVFSLFIVNPVYVYADEYREIRAELKHTFPKGWHTPSWSQIHMLSDHPIGCGPTAWGIVYGYWSAFKGKNNLFDGYDVHTNYSRTPSRNSTVAAALGEISNDTETNYGGEAMAKRFGLTWPKHMCKGIEYAKRKGYSSARCTRIRDDEFDKFDQIKRYIDADKPVILLIKESDRRGIPNHYVVIEAAVKKQKKVMGKWRDRDVKYLVNFGHGPYGTNKRDWIYVREKGRNIHKIWTAASAFLIDIEGKTPATYSETNEQKCKKWCREHPECAECSTLRGCGPGYEHLRSWTGAGKNWHACKKKPSRQEASKTNKEACEEWCREHPECAKCSTKRGCGRGYKNLKSWTGRGENWHACEKR